MPRLAATTVLAAALLAAPLVRADTQPVIKGDPAPLTGLAMDEKTFTRYASAETDLAKCKVDLTASNAAVAATAAQAATAALPTKSGYFWLGVGAGVAATVVVLYGAAQLLKAAPAERFGGLR